MSLLCVHGHEKGRWPYQCQGWMEAGFWSSHGDGHNIGMQCCISEVHLVPVRPQWILGHLGIQSQHFSAALLWRGQPGPGVHSSHAGHRQSPLLLSHWTVQIPGEHLWWLQMCFHMVLSTTASISGMILTWHPWLSQQKYCFTETGNSTRICTRPGLQPCPAPGIIASMKLVLTVNRLIANARDVIYSLLCGIIPHPSDSHMSPAGFF